MRNDDGGNLQIFPQFEDEVQKLFAVLVIERRRRLIKDQEPHVFRKRFRDLDELLLADAELVDRDARRDVEADALHERDGFLVAFLPIHDAVALAFVAEEHVLHDGEIRHERELLMDDDDAALLAVTDGLELARLAVVNDVALIRPVRVDARKDVHERRLAGAVLAAERVNRAFFHFEVHVIERAHAARKFFDDVLHFQKVLCHTCTFFLILRGGAVACAASSTMQEKSKSISGCSVIAVTITEAATPHSNRNRSGASCSCSCRRTAAAGGTTARLSRRCCSSTYR